MTAALGASIDHARVLEASLFWDRATIERLVVSGDTIAEIHVVEALPRASGRVVQWWRMNPDPWHNGVSGFRQRMPCRRRLDLIPL